MKATMATVIVKGKVQDIVDVMSKGFVAVFNLFMNHLIDISDDSTYDDKDGSGSS